MSIKILGSRIGSIGDPSEFDGDGDGFRMGRDGEDNVPAIPKKVETIISRRGSVSKFFRSPNKADDTGVSEIINMVDDRGNVLKKFFVMKNDPDWNERKPIPAAERMLDRFKQLEEKYSKEFGDIRDPKNMRKAMTSKFPNLIDADELTDMYPARNEDGSVDVRNIDVGRVVMALHAADNDPEIAQQISVVGASGKLNASMFGSYPGMFFIGISSDNKKPHWAGMDFNPQVEPAFRKDHGWGLTVLSDMKDAGYSQEDIETFYGAYLVAHEFGHAKHLLRVLDDIGFNIKAESDNELISNLKLMHPEWSDKDIESMINVRQSLMRTNADTADRRRSALIEILDERHSLFEELSKRSSFWDNLSDSERRDIDSQQEWLKVSGYAGTNAMEFVAETVAQDLMNFEEGHKPKSWAKMGTWLKSKADDKDKSVIIKKITGLHPKVDGTIASFCSGIHHEDDKKQKENKVLSFTGLTRLKVLGPRIGSIGDPAEFDGDGDGFKRGRDGMDNVPVVPINARIGPGAKFLNTIDQQQAVLEKEFGDLSQRKNAMAAFKKTFPNTTDFSWLGGGDKPLSIFEIGQVVVFLSLGKDQSVANSITSIAEMTTLNEVSKSAVGSVSVEIGKSGNRTGLLHIFRLRKLTHASGHEDKNFKGSAWADDVVRQMRKEGASVEDIDRFYGAAIVHHEWSHAEHNAAAFKYVGIGLDDDIQSLIKRAYTREGILTEAQFDQKLATAVSDLKRLKLARGMILDDDAVKREAIKTIFDKSTKLIEKLINDGLNDGLTASELSNLGPNYARQISEYASFNLFELIAEKNSAIRMGHPVAALDNPAWRKLSAFIKSGSTNNQEGGEMTRNERRALERQRKKKKKSLEKPADPFSMVVIQSCSGFSGMPDQGETEPHGDPKQKKGKKALSFADLIQVKILGKPIGSLGEQDGDGDGFVTGPSGEDNVPAPIAKAKDEAKELWDDVKAKQFKEDSERALKAAEAAKAAKPPKHTSVELARLLRLAHRREDKRGAQKMVRDWAKEIFELEGLGTDGEFHSVLYGRRDNGVQIWGPSSFSAADENNPELHIQISGEIKDKAGKNVGIFERHIYLDSDNRKGKPYAYHEILRIKPEYQGKGIAADFVMGAEAKYEALGLDAIHLHAGLDDGVYTWARAGFNFPNNKDRKKFLEEVDNRYQKLLKDVGGDKSKLIAGGFKTSAVARYNDQGQVEVPTPFFESPDHLEAFLKLLEQAKKQDINDPDALPPSAFTLFPASKFMFRGMNGDMFRPIRSISTSEKSIIITGLDKVLRRV